MKLGFTGSRHGTSSPQSTALSVLLRSLNVTECHHGCCIGADSQFHDMARLLHPTATIVGHPPEDRRLENRGLDCTVMLAPLPYDQRNWKIVEACDMLIATPSTMTEIMRSGTWQTVRFARRQRKPIVLVLPDGSTVREEPKVESTR